MVPEDVRTWKLSNTGLECYSYTILLDLCCKGANAMFWTMTEK